MTLVRLEPATPQSRVKHSTTEPLRSLEWIEFAMQTFGKVFVLFFNPVLVITANSADPDEIP